MGEITEKNEKTWKIPTLRMKNLHFRVHTAQKFGAKKKKCRERKKRAEQKGLASQDSSEFFKATQDGCS